MSEHCLYDYAVIRVVPRVEREEFINVGVIVSCRTRQYLDARFELDAHRLLAFDADIDIEGLRAHLSSLQRICAGGIDAGPIGRLPQRERFHWLVAKRSTVLQTSPVHTGRCGDPEAVIEHLMSTMVQPAQRRALP